MNANAALGDVADISLGQTFRGRAEAEEPEGLKQVRLIQIKDVSEGRLTEIHTLPYANITKAKLKVELQSNDLLLPLRGQRFECMLFQPASMQDETVTVTNQIAIFRAASSEVKIEYLLWYLNSDQGRQSLGALSSGSTVRTIRSADLARLKLGIPALAAQEKIISVYFNQLQQNIVMNKMIQNGTRLSHQICSDLYNGRIE